MVFCRKYVRTILQFLGEVCQFSNLKLWDHDRSHVILQLSIVNKIQIYP